MNTIEIKCAILAQTPQSRWFDLRFKSFVALVNGLNVALLDINSIFPIARQCNIIGYCFNYEEKYYFLMAFKNGMIYECFNVETINFSSQYSHILSSHIVLSSDDDVNRNTFLPFLLSLSSMSRTDLKVKLDNLFASPLRNTGVNVL